LVLAWYDFGMGKEIIIIGTLHGGFVPHDELEQILEELKPDQIFVELTQKEVDEIDSGKSFRDEMVAAFYWAQKRNIKVNRFDINSGGLKEGMTGKESDFLALCKKFGELLKNYSWKELNKKEPWQNSPLGDLDREITEKYNDEVKAKQREEELLKNINQQIISEGKVVILTGTGHLDFFEEKIPQAKFLFR